MKKLTKRINTNIYLNAAIQLGCEYSIIDEDKGYAKISSPKSPILNKIFFWRNKEELLIKLAVLGFNSKESKTLSKDKIKSLTLLEENGIPTTLGKEFDISDRKSIDNFASQLLRSGTLVIKKNFGKGGDHVYLDIKSIPELHILLDNIVSENNTELSKMIIEGYYLGDNYRVLVMDGVVIDIVKRLPPNVVGDGVSTVGELVKLKNEFKKSKGDVYNISVELLNNSGVDLTKVVEEGVRSDIVKTTSLTLGGDIERLPLNSVSKTLIDDFIKIQKISGLRLCGIDVISPNITDLSPSYKINEYNQAPGMSIHYLASYEYSLEAPKKILELYFKNK